MRTLPIPPIQKKAEAKEKPKRFVVQRFGSDEQLEENLNQFFDEGYDLRSISYDPGMERGAWAVVMENVSVARDRTVEPLPSPPPGIQV